jgi:hypothetical protein
MPTIELDKVEAFGLETAPLANYVSQSRKIASEYILKYAGKRRRVYSGTDQPDMFVIVSGVETKLPAEVEAMFKHGNPSYNRLTPVAQSVTVVE